eukprot:CAMPEP_0116848236 /NCGR_PEP_ID=MMETSP0418-20121206/14881_1 /TAXON_ID=1158023 /ORGANISM="Astrosyne radiata, Strain 13vi08-1A" /LENGTH=102 /DNA_ID=CAMNT_0004479777 /DNA_START=294 /DNA_END=602 /DNA_ORIENTATION=+
MATPTKKNAADSVQKKLETQEELLHRMKRTRKANQAIAATAGTVAGLVVLGPIGAVVGGIAAHTVTKATGRHCEHRIRSKNTLKNQRGKSANDKPIPEGVLV